MIKNFYIFSSIIFAFALSSCGKSHKAETTNALRADSFNVNDTMSIQINPKLLEYKTFVEKLDSTDATSIPKAWAKFKEVFANQSFGLCDSGFVMYQTLYDTIEVKLNEKLQSDTTNFDPLFNGEAIPKKLKDFSQQLQINGFKLLGNNGAVYISEDRNKVAQIFYPFLSENMKAYLTEIKTENSEGFAIEDSISITAHKLVERIIWYEKFMYENPNFIYFDKCKNFRKAYLSYLIGGYGKTSLYKNVGSKELSDYFNKAYTYLLSKYPGSETAKLIEPYFTALKQKQTDSVNQLYKSYVIKGMILNLH